MTTTKNRHNDQRSVTLWLQQQLADQVDQAIAAKLALVPGATMSRQTYILHAIQSALGGAAAAPPAPGPAAPAAAPTVHPVEPAQRGQTAIIGRWSAQTGVHLGSVLPRPESAPPLPELLAAFRALFRARKVCRSADDQFQPIYRDQTDAELAESDVEGTTLYQNLLDFARAGAAGLNEATFCPVVGGWEDDDKPKRARVQERFLHIFRDLTDTLCTGVFDSLPGPVAAAQARHVEAQAKTKAREYKAQAKAARAAQRAAKKTAPAAEPAPQQLQHEQPEPLASPFGAGPSES